MLLFRRPAPPAIQHFLDQQSKLDFTYPAVGATAAVPPAGYVVDHTRVKLGEGDAVFASAQAALRNWRHFQLGWVEAWPADTAITPGSVVSILARCGGLWWLNACRIVYVVNERKNAGKPDVFDRFGFAYGTLPGHAESGEERFLIERDRSDGSVWYDILAFSRPRHLLARIGYPWTRKMQKKFARDSAAAVLSACRERGESREEKVD